MSTGRPNVPIEGPEMAIPNVPPDPDLAAVLRVSADRRIAEQIRQAALRRQNTTDTRAEFQVRRDYAKNQLHAVRQQLIAHHQQNGDHQ